MINSDKAERSDAIELIKMFHVKQTKNKVMPNDPAINSALIDAGTQTANTVANIVATSDINSKTRKWNEKMHNLQRSEALKDWATQNEYNSPAQQMNRLKAAGLNPNLVYGHGADAQMAAPMRSSDVKGWSPNAPQFNLQGGEVMSRYYDTQIRKQQIDNLKAQQTTEIEKAALTKAQTLSTLQNTDVSKFDLGLKSDLREISMDTAKQLLEKSKADTRFTLDSNDRAAAVTGQNIQESVERVLRSRAERGLIPLRGAELNQRIKQMFQDTRIKQYDADLKSKGIQPGDAIWWRILSTVVDAWQKGTPFGKALKDAIKLPSGNGHPLGNQFPSPY